jgi:hypothetical protein
VPLHGDSVLLVRSCTTRTLNDDPKLELTFLIDAFIRAVLARTSAAEYVCTYCYRAVQSESHTTPLPQPFPPERHPTVLRENPDRMRHEH